MMSALVRMWQRAAWAAGIVATLTALCVGGLVVLSAAWASLASRQLPFPEADRLVHIGDITPLFDRETNTLRSPQVLGGVFVNTMAYAELSGVDSVRVLGSTGPREVGVTGVTPAFFETLGVVPSVGTTLQSHAANALVAVVSERLWREEFGGEPDLVGTSIYVGRHRRVVVGIAPREFAFPGSTSVWVPMVTAFVNANTAVSVVGRLRSGASERDAAAALETARREIPPGRSNVSGPVVQSLGVFVQGDDRRLLAGLFTAAAFFTALAGAGIASVLLVDGSRRQREMAVRAILGASRARLVIGVVADTTLVMLIGGAAGAVAAAIWLRWFRFAWEIGEVGPGIPASAIVAGLGTCVVLAIVCGVVPALRATSLSPDAARRVVAGSAPARMAQVKLNHRDVLVAAQVGLALALLVGSGLLVRTLFGTLGRDLGFNATNLYALRLELPTLPALVAAQDSFFRQHGMDPFGRFGPGDHEQELMDLAALLEPLEDAEDARNMQVLASLLDGLASHPGVTMAAAIDPVPFTEDAENPLPRRAFVSRPRGRNEEQPHSARYSRSRITPGGFAALEISLLAGRLLQASDSEAERAGSVPRSAVISASLAEALWPGENPLGRPFFESLGNQERTVVGVVTNATHSGARTDAAGMVYVPFSGGSRDIGILVRLAPQGSPEALRMAAGSIAAQVAPTVPPPVLWHLEDLVDGSRRRLRYSVGLVTAFSALGLVVAGLGVYGIVALSVSSRLQEVALRLAVGARPGQVIWLLAKRGLILAAVALPLGMIGGRYLETRLASVFPIHTDHAAFVYIMTSLLVVATVGVASILPARRAAAVNPAKSIRQA